MSVIYNFKMELITKGGLLLHFTSSDYQEYGIMIEDTEGLNYLYHVYNYFHLSETLYITAWNFSHVVIYQHSGYDNSSFER